MNNRKRRRYLSQCDLYVIRIMANETFGMSQPCVSCTKMIKTAGIRRVYYSTNDNEIEYKYGKHINTYHRCYGEQNLGIKNC